MQRRQVTTNELYELFNVIVKMDTDEAAVIASILFGIVRMQHFNR